MTLTEAQRATLNRWLQERWAGSTCPAGHGRWNVAPNLSFMPGFATTEAGPQIMHEAGFRFVVLTCTECAYVALLDAATVGVTS